MPELPEVARFQQALEGSSLRRSIARIHAPAPEILADTSPIGLGRRLAGRRFSGTIRRGKNLFVETDDGRHLRFHFGMTGALRPLGPRDPPPEYTRLLVEFDDGHQLALTMPRKLGAVEPLDNLEAYLAEAGLGPDPLDPTFGYADFLTRLQDLRGMIRSTLMNQEVIAGLGSLYTDEILFQARVYPRKPIPNLKQPAFGRLFHTMRRVLQTAIGRRAQPDRFPDHWLAPHRNQEMSCPRCGRPIERIKAAGR